jgi:hypothetical protein
VTSEPAELERARDRVVAAFMALYHACEFDPVTGEDLVDDLEHFRRACAYDAACEEWEALTGRPVWLPGVEG